MLRRRWHHCVNSDGQGPVLVAINVLDGQVGSLQVNQQKEEHYCILKHIEIDIEICIYHVKMW